MSRHGRGEFWILMIILLGLPFLLGAQLLPKSRETPEQKRRRRSTAAGLAVLLFFVVGITITKGREWYIKRNQEQAAAAQLLNEQRNTDALLDVYAKGFSRGNPEMQNEWAAGNVKDEWGRSIVLVENSAKGTQFLSRGPDGEKGTEDDRVSTLYRPNFNAYVMDEITREKDRIAASKPPEPVEVEETGFRIKWPWSKDEKVVKEVEEAVEETKEAVEAVKEEAESTGLKIKWPWSKEE